MYIYPMKLSLLCLALVGCLGQVEATGDHARTTPDCNGEELDHVCASFAHTRAFKYGVKVTCQSPFLPSSTGDVLRPTGLEGCVDTTAPAVRCCP